MPRTYILDECASTNLEARDAKYTHGDAIIAIRQTAGRGQKGTKWDSPPGENLTFSLVLEPVFLPASRQFLLSEAVALSVADTLAAHGIAARIKWPNDIYVGDRKICGILIEHDLRDGHLARTIVGIGINVNQARFPEWIPNPTSMTLETGSVFDIHGVFAVFYEMLGERYSQLSGGEWGPGCSLSAEEGRYFRLAENGGSSQLVGEALHPSPSEAERMGAEIGCDSETAAGCPSGAEACRSKIEDDYRSLLYRLGRLGRFFVPGRGEVYGTIRAVEPSGRLMIEIDGEMHGFLFKEIEYIL